MSVELIARVKVEADQAISEMKKVGETTEKAMNETTKSVKDAGKELWNFTKAVSGVITSGLALYSAYDKIQDAQRNVEKAQYALKQAQDLAKNAQDKYTEAVNKFGEDSPEAIKALDDLKDAQEKVRLKSEELKDRQDKVGEALISMVSQAIPIAITGLSNLKDTVYYVRDAFIAAKDEVVSFAGTAGLGSLATPMALVAGEVLVAGDVLRRMGDETKTVNDRINDATLSFSAFGQIMVGPVLRGFTETNSWLIQLSKSLAEFSKSFLEIIGNIWVQLGLAKKAFEETYDEVVGGSTWVDMWDEISETTKKGLNANINEIDRAMRDIQRRLSKPFYMEVMLTVNAASIKAQVQAIINEILKSVVIEKTSSQATTSRIRVPATTTTVPYNPRKAPEVWL